MKILVKDMDVRHAALSETLNSVAQKSQQALLNNTLGSFSSNLSGKPHDGSSEHQFKQREAVYLQTIIPKSLSSAKQSIVAKFSKVAKKGSCKRRVEPRASKVRFETAYGVKLTPRLISAQRSNLRANTQQSPKALQAAEADSRSGNVPSRSRNQRCKVVAEQLS